ncbi:hypothetical protein WJX77_010513 [Trebouxia sp. C0004]
MSGIPGNDLHYNLQLEFLEAVFGCRRAILVAAPGEKKRKLDVFVPIGADDGDKIIVEGEGHPSEFQGGCRGNLIVRVKVKGHPKLQRIGSTISSCINVPWAYLPAREGFILTVLTVDGPIQVKLPCNLDDDMNIVIENKGVPTSDGRGIHHVHVRRGRPLERLLFQTAEVALTAAAVCLITVACNRVRRNNGVETKFEGQKSNQAELDANVAAYGSAQESQ